MIYEIYESDNVTPIAIAQPIYSSWETTALAPFADGTPRVAKYRRVEWRFDRLTPAEYQVLIANRPADGRINFKTFRQAVGGTPAQWVKCSGIMGWVVSGTEHEGEYHGVSVAFTRAVPV